MYSHLNKSHLVKKKNSFVGYPPFPYPGAHQQQPFQHGIYPPQGQIQGRQESAIRHGIASNVMVIGRTYHGRSCTYRLTRLGISFFLIGVILLIILGVLVIRPTLNDTRLQSTRCTVISSKYTHEDISCDCGRYCTSRYPCLQIQVSYSAKRKRQTGYLYEDVYVDKNKVMIFFYLKYTSWRGEGIGETFCLKHFFQPQPP